MNFAPQHLTNFVNDNPVETQIVQVDLFFINELPFDRIFLELSIETSFISPRLTY